MALDLAAWRTTVQQVVDAIANEDLQRRAWFGIGPEVSSPDEEFCRFFDDVAVQEFVDRADNGLNASQAEAGRRLVALMRELAAETAEHVEPSDLIDDPRWQEIRAAAAQFSGLLQA